MKETETPHLYTLFMDTTRPDKHGRVFLVPCFTLICPVYAAVHVNTGQVTFHKVPEIPFNYRKKKTDFCFFSDTLHLPNQLIDR